MTRSQSFINSSIQKYFMMTSNLGRRVAPMSIKPAPKPPEAPLPGAMDISSTRLFYTTEAYMSRPAANSSTCSVVAPFDDQTLERSLSENATPVACNFNFDILKPFIKFGQINGLHFQQIFTAATFWKLVAIDIKKASTECLNHS